MSKRWLLLPPPSPPIRTTGFERLFEPDRVIRVAGNPATLEVREVGTLDMPTGRLIACDPVVQATDPDYHPAGCALDPVGM